MFSINFVFFKVTRIVGVFAKLCTYKDSWNVIPKNSKLSLVVCESCQFCIFLKQYFRKSECNSYINRNSVRVKATHTEDKLAKTAQ
jgi:hypothetical protein